MGGRAGEGDAMVTFKECMRLLLSFNGEKWDSKQWLLVDALIYQVGSTGVGNRVPVPESTSSGHPRGGRSAEEGEDEVE